jgi:putative ABC transport system permease protein
MFLVVKSRLSPEKLIAPIRRELRRVDPNVPAFEIRTMSQALSNELAIPRLPMALLGVFAAVAALLGALGVFGAVGYWVGSRTREIGVRSALGATRRDVRMLVLRQGGCLALAGTGAGILAALATARYMEGLLYGVSARDGMIYGAAAIGALLVTVAACLAPAERAARVDPATALRQE